MTNKQRGEKAKEPLVPLAMTKEQYQEEKAKDIEKALKGLQKDNNDVITEEMKEAAAEKVRKIAREKQAKINEAQKVVNKAEQDEKIPVGLATGLPQDIIKLKKNKKVSIIGFAGSWYQAPWKDKDMDFWGINELYKYSGPEAAKYKVNPHYDVWFEIHDILNSPSKQQKEHQNFLQTLNIPLVTQKHWDKYPSSMAYPRKEVKEYFNSNFVMSGVGAEFTDYSNQISWMTALAIMLGYEEIHIYGVDMAANTEYNFQRASCQFFIGYAAGKGIKVLIPKSSELCKHYCDYGFETDNAGRHRTKDRIKDLNHKLRDMEQRLAEIEYNKDKLKKKLDNKLALIHDDIRVLNNEKIKINAVIEASKATKTFLLNAPNTLKDYLEKRQGILTQINQLNAQDAQTLKKLADELKKVEQKEDFENKQYFMNVKLLDDEAKFIEKNMYSIQGTIGENQHLLKNNLI